MIEPSALVRQARSWLGVPFLHQGRSRIGVDCLGYVSALLAELGCGVALELLPTAYARNPQAQLERIVEANTREIPLAAGALIMIKFPHAEFASHAAIYTGTSMIHAYQQIGRVVEHAYGEPWIRRTKAVRALPLVAYE